MDSSPTEPPLARACHRSRIVSRRLCLDAPAGISYAPPARPWRAADEPDVTRIPFIRASVLLPFVAFLQQVGAPVGRYLEDARIGRELLEDAEGFVPTVFLFRFVELAARRAGIDDLGLRVGQAIDPLSLGAFGRAIAAAGTVGGALTASVAHRPALHSGERAWITRMPDLFELHHRYLPACEAGEQVVAAGLTLHLNLLRHTVPGAAPAHVGLPVRPSRAYAALPVLANTRIEFDRPRTTIAFRPETFAAPLAGRSPAVAATSGAARASIPGGLVESIEAFIGSLLAIEPPRIELVAEAAGLNPRTLQRRLAEAGATFAGLVARTRLERARQRLIASDERIVDVAFAVGYADAAHFTRAFKRWTGLAPLAYRTMHAASSTRRAS